jgi:hypothetical protein
LPVGWRKGSLRECTPPLWDCRTRRSGPRPAAGVELSRPHRVRARCTRVTTRPPFDGGVVSCSACRPALQVRRVDHYVNGPLRHREMAAT